MKRLLLIALLACPALKADEGLEKTFKTINNHRLTSGVKAVVCTVLGYYSYQHAWKNFHEAIDDLQKWNKNAHGKSFKEFGNHAVLTGGMGYASYRLLNYAWKSAKHALAIK